MMARISTEQILYEKASNRVDAKSCVSWAVVLLENGDEGKWVTQLAGMSPPFNNFEIAELRDKVLKGMNVPKLSLDEVVDRLAYSLIDGALLGSDESLVRCIKKVARIHIESEYSGSISIFSQLSEAYDDIKANGHTYCLFLHEPTVEKVVTLMKRHAGEFVEHNKFIQF